MAPWTRGLLPKSSLVWMLLCAVMSAKGAHGGAVVRSENGNRITPEREREIRALAASPNVYDSLTRALGVCVCAQC